jgi:hypothetical protein
MAETLDAQLTRVQAAIAAIESGHQSYSVDGVTFTRANLKTLYEREARLLNLVARSDIADGGRTLAEF